MAPRRVYIFRACVEITFIIFLFYSNLLMGEFTVANGSGKTWKTAFTNIVTAKNLLIGCVAAVVGFFLLEALRARTRLTDPD